MVDVVAGAVGGVDGEGEGMVDLGGDVGFEDEGSVWVRGFDVGGKLDESFVNLDVVIFADQEDVAWGSGPLQC